MTLDEAALEEAKSAHVDALVFKRLGSALDAISDTYEFYEKFVPPGYDPGPITDRAREMLQEWNKHSTPEIEQEIVERARAKRERLLGAGPAIASLLKEVQ